MTDEELDRDWKPNGRRPQSTIARSFSAELADIFRLENSVSDLDQQVDQRKQIVGKSNQELADLEARIREMEHRLRQSKHERPGLSQVLSGNEDTHSQQQEQVPASSKNDDKSRSRPGTARASQTAPSSGNMPPTPGASEDGNAE